MKRITIKKGDRVSWLAFLGEVKRGEVIKAHRDGTLTVSMGEQIDRAAVVEVNDREVRRKIGGRSDWQPATYLDPRLDGTFGLYTFPDREFRIHPACDGLICASGEVVLQARAKGSAAEWLDFIREQQREVVRYLA